MKSPIHWFGSKGCLIDELLERIPVHKTYVEVFGGGASLLFAKPKSAVEVYNDINSELVNFYRQLRDNIDELNSKLILTPFSREEFYKYREIYRARKLPEDDVERARIFFLLIQQCFNSDMQALSWKFSANDGKLPGTWFNSVLNLVMYVDRLKNVYIENDSYEMIFKRYDGPETYFYMDPPYVTSRRRGGGYEHEFKHEDHEKFLKKVLELEGMVLISGYDHYIYNRYLKDWHKESFEVLSAATSGGIAGKEQDTRTEVIWYNHKAEVNMSKQLGMF